MWTAEDVKVLIVLLVSNGSELGRFVFSSHLADYRCQNCNSNNKSFFRYSHLPAVKFVEPI